VANGVSLKLLIAVAYRLQAFQMAGVDGWIADDQWSIEAKADVSAEPPPTAPPYMGVPEGTAVRLRGLLEDRFALKTHRETRERGIYALTVEKNGSKLKAVDPPAGTQGGEAPGSVRSGPGQIAASAVTMDQAIVLLNRQRQIDRPVVDKTGLKGRFSFDLRFDPETTPAVASSAAPADATISAIPAADDAASPSIFTAIQEQLGLKLEPEKEPVEVMVVDSAHKPSEN
jgi:uncharacterized protein (TIGR03435 family)